MNIHEFALRLNGREYGGELTQGEIEFAKELGYVIVFGSSDDNTEFRGAIDDEVGCYEGAEILLNKNGIFKDCECKCTHSKLAKLNTKVIEAVWGREYSWTYETNIPHAKFEILEDSEKYCLGIVFEIKSL